MFIVPTGLKKNRFVFFAVDNIDFAEDTVDGKNTLHGTVMTVYQQEDALADPVVPPLELDTLSSQSLKSPYRCGYPKLMSCDIKGTPIPKSSPKYKFTENRQVLIFDQYQKDNLAWLTACTMQHTWQHTIPWCRSWRTCQQKRPMIQLKYPVKR